MTNLIQKLRIEATNNNKKKENNITSGDALQITTTQYKNKKRKQLFKGVCMGIKRREGLTTIRIRNIVAGEGVEQTFMLESPLISQVDILDKLKTGTRAKKYYLRTRSPSESKA